MHFPLGCLGLVMSSHIINIGILYYPPYRIQGRSEPIPCACMLGVPSPPLSRFPSEPSTPPSSLAVRGSADGPRQSQETGTHRSLERSWTTSWPGSMLSESSQVGVRHRRRGLEVEESQLPDAPDEQGSALCARTLRGVYATSATLRRQQLRQLSHSRIYMTWIAS